jgi:hypothetical protein
VVAPDEELLPAAAPRIGAARLLLWVVAGLLALLVVMTLVGLAGAVHGRAGTPHVPPSPAPSIPGDMPHGR